MRAQVHEINGKRGTLRQLCAQFQIPMQVIYQRKHDGMSLEEAFAKPYTPRGKQANRLPPGPARKGSRLDHIRERATKPLTAVEKMPPEPPKLARTIPDPGPPGCPKGKKPRVRPEGRQSKLEPTELPSRPAPAGFRWTADPREAFETTAGRLGMLPGRDVPGAYPEDSAFKVHWLKIAPRGDGLPVRQDAPTGSLVERIDAGRREGLERLFQIDVTMAQLTKERAELLAKLAPK